MVLQALGVVLNVLQCGSARAYGCIAREAAALPSGEHEGKKFDFTLDKYDEFGRKMTPKEAFRDLCHKFHGIEPSKNKKEKRLKQASVAPVRVRGQRTSHPNPNPNPKPSSNPNQATEVPLVAVAVVCRQGRAGGSMLRRVYPADAMRSWPLARP